MFGEKQRTINKRDVTKRPHVIRHDEIRTPHRQAMPKRGSSLLFMGQLIMEPVSTPMTTTITH
jgi:hypothetical protein